MAETLENQDVDSNQALPTEIDTSRDELMQRLNISSVNTLKKWCSLWQIPYKASFTPTEVSKLYHCKEHIQDRGMTYANYEAMLKAESEGQTPEATQEHGRYTSNASNQAKEESSEIGAIIRNRYGNTLDKLAKPIAQAFWTELDRRVMSELTAIAKADNQPTLVEAFLLPELPQKEVIYLPSTDNAETHLVTWNG